MSNQTDFKALWQGLSTGPVPPVETVIAEAKKLLRQTKKKMLIANVTLALTAACIMVLYFKLDIKQLTTRLGILLIILSIAVYLVMHNRLLAGLFKPVPGADSRAYLDALLAASKKQQFLQRTVLSLYYVFLLAGICLYMIEYTAKMPLWGAMLSYALTLCWMGICWFIFRPRTIRKQQAGLDAVISKLENMHKQMEADTGLL